MHMYITTFDQLLCHELTKSGYFFQILMDYVDVFCTIVRVRV